MKTIIKDFSIPIFPATFYVSVADKTKDAFLAMVSWSKSTAATAGHENASGLAAYLPPWAAFGVAFEYENLYYDIVAHEVYHVTGMIAKNFGITDSTENEAACCLNGYLMDKVLMVLSKSGLVVKHDPRSYVTDKQLKKSFLKHKMKMSEFKISSNKNPKT